MKKINVADVTKDELCHIINALGCPMVKQYVKKTHSKADVIEVLKHCRCPVLKKLFTGY